MSQPFSGIESAMKLRYTHASESEPGTNFHLLEQSYAPLVESEPEVWAQERENWKASDRAVCENPHTIEACTCLSWHGMDLVGFFSFDPDQGLSCSGPPHEVYVSDPRRVAPERLKTIVRIPVC